MNINNTTVTDMITKMLAFSLFVITIFSLTPAWADDRAPDATHGKTLHNKNCMGCHNDRQYTRPNRIVHTFGDLRSRVEFCDAAANANFSSDDLNDVVEYLNTRFYKFKK